MQRDSYLKNLASLAAATLILGVALFLGPGPRWFSFYGLATLVLVALPLLAAILMRRYRQIGLKRWPVILAILPAILAALVQIGFWLAFFEGGPATVPLSAVRSLVQPLLDPALLVGGIIVFALTVWMVLRGAVKRGD